jgi:hypothetical protein
VQTPATHELSLVMSRGKRFESARRLSSFIEVRWKISVTVSLDTNGTFVWVVTGKIASLAGCVSYASRRAMA